MFYFYSDFIDKLIRAGRNDGTGPSFKFPEEIERDDFIRYANRFIENYYATVPPDFARTHPMKFSLGTFDRNGNLMLNRNISTREIDQFPGLNGGILFLEPKESGNEEGSTLDGAVYRQACFIRRENTKFWIGVAGVAVAIAALVFSLTFRK